MEDQLHQTKDKLQRELDKEKGKFEEKASETQRRFQVELKQAKEQLKIEQEQWKEEYTRKQQEQNKEYLKRVNEELTKEKNTAIAGIIEKLGDETYSTQQKLEKKMELDLKERDNKHKAEINEYKALMQQWKEKYQLEQINKQKLDDNLSTLMKRFYDMELELTSSKEK